MKTKGKMLTGIFVLMSVIMLLTFTGCPNETPGGGGTPGTSYSISKGDITGVGNFSISPGTARRNATITLTVTEGILLNWDITYDNGTKTLTATQGTPASKWTFSMPADNVTVNAEFTDDPDADLYTVTKGTITGTGNFSISRTTDVPEGVDITLTVTSGTLLSWDISSGIGPIVPDTGAAGVYTFEMPASHVIVNAAFTSGGGPGPDPSDAVYTLYSNGVILADPEVWEADRGQEAEFNAVVSGYKDHTEAIQLGPVMGEYGGGLAFIVEGGIDLGTVDALSFMAKSPDGFEVTYVGFGEDTLYTNTYSIQYTGETDSGFTVGTDWQQYIIPLPARRPGISVSTAFALWGANLGKTLYLDDIIFIEANVALADIVLQTPEEISNSSDTLISSVTVGMKAVYNIDGSVVSLYVRGVKFGNWYSVVYNASGAANISGDGLHVTPVNSGPFNFTVSFGGKTGSTIGEVSATSFLYIEDCLTLGQVPNTWEPPSELTGRGYGGASWYAAIAEYDNRNTITIMNHRWGDGSPGSGGTVAVLNRTGQNWPLSGLSKITFDATVEGFTTGTAPNFIFRLSAGATTYSRTVTGIPTNGTWQNFIIDFSQFAPAIPANTTLTGWEMEFTAGTTTTDVFLHVGPIKATE